MSETSFWSQGLIGFMGDAYTVITHQNPLEPTRTQGPHETPWTLRDRRRSPRRFAPLDDVVCPIPHQNPVRDIALVPWSKGLLVPKNQDEVTEERPSDQRDRGTNRLTDERTSRGQYRFVVFVISSLLSSPPHESNYGTEYGCNALRGKRAKQINGYIYEKSFTISIGCHFYDDHSLGTRVGTTICVARV